MPLSKENVINSDYLDKIKKEISNLKIPSKEYKGDGKVKKKFIGDVDTNHVYLVDGDSVKLLFTMDFVEAGNYKRYSFIPKKEIWLDKNLSYHEILPNCLHEVIEIKLMSAGWDYDSSHDFTNKKESEFRQDLKIGAQIRDYIKMAS